MTSRFVLAAAWWYDFTCGVAVVLAHYPATLCGRCVSLQLGFRVDSTVDWLMRWLLLNKLAWLIAREHLLATWEAELDDERRLFVLDRSDQWGQP